ncbi:MAG: alginate export family protein [Phycisphaerales bacterium]
MKRSHFYRAALMVSLASIALAEPTPQSSADDQAPVEQGERFPLGWLSDPDEPADDLFDALTSGKIHLDNRLRFEHADTTGSRSSAAVTNRLRLGYESKPIEGFSGFIEMENVSTFDGDRYFVPATGDGDPTRTVIADPIGTEINQAYLRYSPKHFNDSDLSLDLRAGRQRIILDDSRFVGNVGWRQFEQTYDAVSIRTNFGLERFSAFYAYIWGVQRIFGPDGLNPESESHIINASYRIAPELSVTAFSYILDFKSDLPANSSDTYGVRLSGKLFDDPNETDDLFAEYELTYANQTDAGRNPTSYDADFYAAQLKLTQPNLGYLIAGYQFLGSDNGVFAFRFPLGTNHKFQGFADNFLTTPAGGLQDLYFGIGADLPWGIKGSVTYHQFWSDQGSNDLGYEIDVVASKELSPNWSVLAKYAYFDGDRTQPDTERLWFMTTFKF